MARGRTISPAFWTWETAFDYAPMTRLLFPGPARLEFGAPADWQRLDAGVTGYRLRREAHEPERMAA